MKEKSPAVQWYPKQALGDDKILAMDWDAKGMHYTLLWISWQQEPPGTLPNDMAAIRRWIGSPSDDVWRRVSSQILAAWPIQGDRRVNAGMFRAWERQQTYKQNGSKKGAKSKLSLEDEEEDSKKPVLKAFRIDELVSKVLIGISLPAGNPVLECAIAAAIEAKGAEPNWTPEKAALHMIERGNAYKASSQFHSDFKKSWPNWFKDQGYEQIRKGEHVTDSGQKIDRGYIPLKKT